MTPKEKISKAIREPAGAPKELTESMVATVKAIEIGRTAEKNLISLGNAAPKSDVRDLTAVAAVGRLAQNHRLPAGADAAKLAEQMKELPAFTALADRPPEEIGHDLETGKFTDDLTRAAEHEMTGMNLAAKAPEIEVPEIEAPEKQAPLM